MLIYIMISCVSIFSQTSEQLLNSCYFRPRTMFKKLKLNFLWIWLFLFSWSCVNSATDQFEDIGEDQTPSRYQVLQFKFSQVTDVYAITLWILLGSLTKIG